MLLKKLIFDRESDAVMQLLHYSFSLISQPDSFKEAVNQRLTRSF